MKNDSSSLLAGLQDCVDGLAASRNSPQDLALQTAARCIIGELNRRENAAKLAEHLERGIALAQSFAKLLRNSSSLSEYLAGRVAILDARTLVDEGTLRDVLSRLLASSAYPRPADSELDAMVRQIIDWEAAQYELEPVAKITERQLAVLTPEKMEKIIHRLGPDFRDAEITKFNTLFGGFSKTTTLFEVKTAENRTLNWVARIAGATELLDLPGQDVAKEYHLLRYLSRHGLRIARPLWLVEDLSVCGLKFFVSEQASGRNYGTAISSEPLNPAQVQSLAEVLVQIHSVPLDPDDADLKRSPIDAGMVTQSLAKVARDYVMLWKGQWEMLEAGPYPAIDAIFMWLLSNVPQTDDVPVLAHADYALHNILIDGDRVSAVLDWEVSHVGDRARDISWLLATIGQHVRAEDFMTAYVRAGGRPVSAFRLKYYEILSQMGLMVAAVAAKRKFQRNREVGPNFCTLGLGFMHLPAAAMTRMIDEAENASKL